MANINRLRILFDLGVVGELAGTHLDLEYGSQSQEAAQAANVMDAVWDWWTPGLAPPATPASLFSSDVKLAMVSIQRIAPDVGPVYTDDRADSAGTGPGTSAPPQAAIVASYRTNVSARRQRGRSFFPPPPENQVGAQGFLIPSYADDLRDHVQALAEEIESPGRLIVGTVDIEHVIWSTRARDAGGALLAAAAFPVTRYLVGQRVDTQRRRLPREQVYSS